ncbi:hypothetical protein [Lacrimispora indolis]|uniref:hypothetical protein n=1 Tax=Lacrimispora indolis TaxID=69825 RepID=UPI000462A1D4|nr:hypothetical protein [[Clostridium] methoxybenzovorans]
MKTISTREQIIKYLLSLQREYKKNQIQVTISRNSFNGSDISNIGEQELINQLAILETEGLITVNFLGPKRDLSCYITIILHDTVLNYFDNKKQIKITQRNQWIQFWIPVSISVVALVVSIIALL